MDHFRSEDGLSSNVVSRYSSGSRRRLMAGYIPRPGLFSRYSGSQLLDSRGTDQRSRSSRYSHRGMARYGLAIMEALISCAGTSCHRFANKTVCLGNGSPHCSKTREGRIWIGVDSMLTVYEHGRLREIRRPDGTSLGVVIAMTEDTDGNIWASVIGKNVGASPHSGSGSPRRTRRGENPPR